MIPYNTYIKIDRKSSFPVYLQVSQQLAEAIQKGHIPEGTKLPGTRKLAQLIGLHRNTVSSSFQVLESQGWIISRPRQGTFVQKSPGNRQATGVRNGFPAKTGFYFHKKTILDNPYTNGPATVRMDDGLPDMRLTHMDYLARLFHINMKRRGTLQKLSADSTVARGYYRENLCNYLNRTRGLGAGTGQVLVTRNQELAAYIVAETLLNPGDRVVVGTPGYFAANMTLQKTGAKILTVPADERGLDVDALEKLCRQQKIRMVYLTPHYHYPTTVPLSPERRMTLLDLAAKNGFIILEDDLDYDFNYTDEGPLLPLAALDTCGMVVYVGTFGQTLPSAFRSGFVVAPDPLIAEMEKLQNLMDRFGDVLGEMAMGEMIAEGEIYNYLRQCTVEYRKRRDQMACSLVSGLGHLIDFQVPDGGLATWTNWPETINLMRFSRLCAREGLHIPPYLLYQSRLCSGVRMGFGSLSVREIKTAIEIMQHSTQYCV
ncbi:MAG TPA: PLP-dependent aminotransferase family protein [Sphingobacteriaceae bacterium]|nr:PLP-dependent aminotransferase family protein [Sphingobacteriaceae bacterium]